jgi:hypothetical protein
MRYSQIASSGEKGPLPFRQPVVWRNGGEGELPG